MRKFMTSTLLRVLIAGLVLSLVVSCGGRKSIPDHDFGWESRTASADEVDSTALLEALDTVPTALASADSTARQPADSTHRRAGRIRTGDSLAPHPAGPHEEEASRRHLAWLYGAQDDESDIPDPIYYGEVDTEDSASAVDDAVWRMLGLAEEYHSMGVLANREANWEEAQYYFEKSIKIMAGLDIETDTIPTPEATKYNTLLDNVISDYRLTLRSLGQLEGDVTPSVLVERFADLEERLEGDSLYVSGQREREITYDLPIKMNDRVKSSIVYFQTVARDAFRKYLGRSKKYEKLFKEVLTRHGLPQDLIYLCLVESGFNTKAYSWARASGLWQFIASTGRLYGLERDWWIDERRDPKKATEAAARFLKDLYREFGDWELAMAAYNGGPGRVRSTIKKQGTEDFWRMRLRRQTMDYVPLIYAAAIIAKDPERYGFRDVEYEPELRWDEVTIDRCLDLKAVAEAVGCSVDELKEYNPELLRNYTPPGQKHYVLKLPHGVRSQFLAAYESMPSPQETSWVTHTIRKGETISSIAAKYGVSQYAILESNHLGRNARIIAGKTLIVPVPLDREFARTTNGKNREYKAEGSVYTVRQGDTMWDIARAFGTTVDALRRVNYIERGARIYVGQRLKLPSNAANLKQLAQSNDSPAQSPGGSSKSGSEPAPRPSSGAVRTHKVRVGDTLWEIARLYGTTTTNLRKLNNLSRTGRIYPGQILQVGGASAGTDFVTYTVQRGDSLARIARQFGTSISRILALNELDDPDNLQVGQVLKIKAQ
ncbi:MAG: LysM peptidoglycan-binding domain-containing protein [Candidatus Zixiibacteriota bacterium]